MRSLLGILFAFLIVACSEKTITENFAVESGLQACSNIALVQTAPVKPQGEIDYTYEVHLDGIRACSTMTRAVVERNGYICMPTDAGAACSKVFEDGSIAQLRLNGNYADFSRRHNR